MLLLPSLKSISQWNASYNYQQLSSISVLKFSFSNPQYGWLVYHMPGTPSGDDGINILRTDNFANVWGVKRSMIGQLGLNTVIAPNQDTMYCFYTNYLHSNCDYTYDGGITWLTRDLPKPYDWVYEVEAMTSDTLILTGYQGQIFKYTPDTVYSVFENDSFNFSISNIYFNSLTNGYIIGRDASNNSILLRTINGGEDWTVVNRSSNFKYRDLYFSSDSVGYVCGEDGKFLKTIDFGQHFNEINIPVNGTLTELQFSDEQSGYCIGLDGICLQTRNGGDTWIDESFGSGSNLSDIQMFTVNSGYILQNLGKGFKVWNKYVVTSVPEVLDNKLEIYPNPVTNDISINLLNNEIIEEIYLYNLAGEKIFCSFSSSKNIDLSNFDNGIYIVKVITDTHVYQKQILKL